MNKYLKLLTIALICAAFSIDASAQCDSIAKLCSKNIPVDYISDGQSYRAFLVDDETAEFRTTFFAGTDYRIASCGGFEPTNVKFRVLDEKRNVLFTNEDYELISYWNFRADYTTECIIEAQLNTESVESGCAVILISFAR